MRKLLLSVNGDHTVSLYYQLSRDSCDLILHIFGVLHWHWSKRMAPKASEETLKCMGQINRCLTTAKYNTVRTMCIFLGCTVRCRYNAVNFHPNVHKRHLIVRPKARDMGCLLWIEHLIHVLPLSLSYHMQNHVMLDIAKTALHCTLDVHNVIYEKW